VKLSFKKFLVEQASEFDQLKKNKKALTDEEREECMKKEAVWHMQSNGRKPSPAVWKSVNKNGKPTYVTNTHRAYKTASSLGAAIKQFHDVIKDTA
jgi:hypothetical protein